MTPAGRDAGTDAFEDTVRALQTAVDARRAARADVEYRRADAALEPADDGTVGQAAMIATTGITYRQLDYWTRRGYLRPDNAGCGSGRQRRWSAAEQRICTLIIRLCRAGLDLGRAAEVARQAVGSGSNGGRLGYGVHIAWTPGEPA